MKNLIIRNLKEVRELGEDLEQKFPDLRQRLLDAPDKTPVLVEAGTPLLAVRITAGAPESEAA